MLTLVLFPNLFFRLSSINGKGATMEKMKLKGIVQNGPEQIVDVEIGKEDNFAFYSLKGKIYPKVCWKRLS